MDVTKGAPGSPAGPKSGSGSQDTSLKRSLIYFATVAVGQGVSFLLLPFVSRMLSPEAYGAYAVALAVSTLVGMVASSWIRNVALRLYFDAVARGTSRGFFVGTAALQAALFVALYTLTLTILSVLGWGQVPTGVMVRAGITVLVGDLAVYAITLLRAQKRTGPFAVAEIGSGLLRFGFTLGGLALGFRSAELLFDASTAGYLLGAAYAVPVLWRRLEGSARIDVRATLEVARHGPAALPFSVANWVERLADRLILEHFLGTAVVGIYTVGYSVGERIMGTLTSAVFMMAWPNILAAWKDGGAASARSAVREAMTLFVWFTSGPAVFLIGYGGDFYVWIAGAAYHEAAIIVPIVAASMWIGAFGSYLNRHLELHKRFATLSALTAAGSAVNVALNFWLIPAYGMVGAALATLVNRVLNALVFFAIRDRALVAIPWRSMAWALACSLALWGCTSLIPAGPLVQMSAYVVLYAPVALIAMKRARAS